jgi:hypothetical protein
LLTATLLAATLFFTLSLLAFALLSIAVLLLSAQLSRVGVFAWFVWILLCFHDAFLYSSIRCLGRSHFASRPFSIKSPWKAIRTETHNRGGGWLSYQAKPYWTHHHVIWIKHAIVYS